jgi:hypothetical protein
MTHRPFFAYQDYHHHWLGRFHSAPVLLASPCQSSAAKVTGMIIYTSQTVRRTLMARHYPRPRPNGPKRPLISLAAMLIRTHEARLVEF